MLASLLAVPLPVAADWLQTGYDGARTGAAQGLAPAWDDVAFSMQLPYGLTDTTAPIVLNGTIYVVMPGDLGPRRPAEIPAPVGRPTSPSIVYSISLANPVVTEFARIDWPMYQLASDGVHLFTTGRNRVDAFLLDGGARAWSSLVYAAPDQLVEANRPGWDSLAWAIQTCGAPAVADGVVYVGCLDGSAGRWSLVAGAFWASNGTSVWGRNWVADSSLPTPSEACVASPGRDCVFAYTGEGFGSSNEMRAAEADSQDPPLVSVVANYVFVSESLRYRSPSGADGTVFTGSHAIHALSRTSGEGRVLISSVQAGETGPTSGTFLGEANLAPSPTGNAEFVFARGYMMQRYPASSVARGGADDSFMFRPWNELDLGGGLAYANGVLYCTSLTTLQALDSRLEPGERFVPFALPLGEAWDHGSLAVAGEVVVGRTTRPDAEGLPQATSLYVVSAQTGEFLWRHPFHTQTHFAVSDDVLVALEKGGRITVLGSLPISLQPNVRVSEQYPRDGEAVRVDLAATQPGIFGEATEFKVDWGDGKVTDWQEKPVLTHQFERTSSPVARFFVRNEQNQSASVRYEFHVNAVNPSQTFFNDPFDNRYEETRFFIFGLLITGAAALFGFARTGRKRRRLQRELRELEGDYDRLHADAAACDAMLARRKANARSLFLERKLEEAHASFLTGRIEELRRNLRLGTVDARLKFLPHGIVLQLQRLLADARVDEYERDHFVAALELEDSLTQVQRSEVARLIDSWFARDSGELGSTGRSGTPRNSRNP